MPRALPLAAALLAAVLVSACGADQPSAGPAPSTSGVPTSSPAAPTSAPTFAPTPSGTTTGDSSGTRSLAERVRRQLAHVPATRTAPKRAVADDPLADHPWGTYEGDQDLAWEPYARASGATRSALAAIALTPKAKWFGYWIPNGDIASKVDDYVANATGGDPDVMVQMTLFRMVPWERETCQRRPSAAEAASYRDWIDRFAAALGDTYAAIVLQPDGPFALCAPGGPAAPAALISYSARVLSALPHTSVYLEAGAADWPYGPGGVEEALRFLIPDGVQYTRGISMDTTHYASTEDDVLRGAAIVEALAARGITGKHVVLNTAMNGDPHPFEQGNPANPNYLPVCHSPTDPGTCVALGIPPTTDVASPRWGLSAEANAAAKQYVDAYLWVGRPWLYKGATPFLTDRALDLVRTAQYRDLLPASGG